MWNGLELSFVSLLWIREMDLIPVREPLFHYEWRPRAELVDQLVMKLVFLYYVGFFSQRWLDKGWESESWLDPP